VGLDMIGSSAPLLFFVFNVLWIRALALWAIAHRSTFLAEGVPTTVEVLFLLSMGGGIIGLTLVMAKPFSRLGDAQEQRRLVGLLEAAYPGVDLPICCSTRGEASLVRYLFDEKNRLKHREMSLDRSLPSASTPSSARRPRF